MWPLEGELKVYTWGIGLVFTPKVGFGVLVMSTLVVKGTDLLHSTKQCWNLTSSSYQSNYKYIFLHLLMSKHHQAWWKMANVCTWGTFLGESTLQWTKNIVINIKNLKIMCIWTPTKPILKHVFINSTHNKVSKPKR